MICKFCNNEIENDSIFCRFCGEKVVRARRKPKAEISVPPPALTPSGKYRGRVMVNGQRVWITEDTEAAYYIRARAIKSGLIEQQKTTPGKTLGVLIDQFITDNEAICSMRYPSRCQTRWSINIFGQHANDAAFQIIKESDYFDSFDYDL